MIRVWDPFVRAFHWALVLSFALAWLSSEDAEGLHAAAGYVGGARRLGIRRAPLRALLAVRAAAADGRRLSAGGRGRVRTPLHRPQPGWRCDDRRPDGRADGDRGDGLAAHHRRVLGSD